jgi:septal ring factor EnvC (AmiA/AmiB activator)
LKLFLPLYTLTDSNDDLASAEAMLAATAEMLRQMREHDEARNQRQQMKLAAQKALIERLEHNHAKHADRMAKLDETLAEVKDVQKDIRSILQIMTHRFAGE